MSTSTTDTVIERVARVKHSLQSTGDPRTVQAAVDGRCPGEGCDGRIVAIVHADSTSVHCDACGRDFPV